MKIKVTLHERYYNTRNTARTKRVYSYVLGTPDAVYRRTMKRIISEATGVREGVGKNVTPRVGCTAPGGVRLAGTETSRCTITFAAHDNAPRFTATNVGYNSDES